MENELKRKYQYGWYGTCEGECKPFYLNQFNDRDKIESIIRVSVADGRSFEKFTAYDESKLSWVSNLPSNESFDDYINPQFKHLECGMGYLVVRKTTDFGKLEIKDFQVGNYNGPASGKPAGFVALSGCPDATPTPTPAPPFIKIELLEVDYNYAGKPGEALIKFKIRLLETKSWQYQVSGSQDVFTVLAQNGQAILEKTFVSKPGEFSLTVTGLDSSGKPVNVKDSKDTRYFKVLAPTPTPTPEKTPTPTPTQTPTPSQTPFNCECIVSTHSKIVIQTTPSQVSGGHTFAGFSKNSEVGIKTDQFTSAVASTVNINKPDGKQLGVIVFSGIKPNNATIYVKDGTSRVCYEGVASSSNGDGETWTLTMKARELPGDCQPTPTPEKEECCDGLTEYTTVTDKIQPKNTVSGETTGVQGKLCWTKFESSSEASDKAFNCPFEVADWSKGGLVILVQSPIDSSNNKFRFESTDGKCYEANLVDSGDGANIFKRIK